MKASTPLTTDRRPWSHLLVALLVLVLAGGAAAGDPDDDWGLPTLTDSGNASDESDPVDQDSSSGDSSTEDTELHIRDILVSGEYVESGSRVEVGRLVLDRSGHDGTTFQPMDTAEAAEVAPAGSHQPMWLASLDDGVALQTDGSVQVHLGPLGQGDLRARLDAPQQTTVVAGFLVVDHGLETLEGLLDVNSSPQGVGTIVHLGEVATVDLNTLQHDVQTQGAALHGTHVSVVLLSLDYQGELHVAAARVPIAGGPIEVVAR